MYQTFIQWKGTDLCMDLNCPKCGFHSHFDGSFAYVIRCPKCRTYFELGTEVSLKELSGPLNHNGLLLSVDDEETTK